MLLPAWAASISIFSVWSAFYLSAIKTHQLLLKGANLNQSLICRGSGMESWAWPASLTRGILYNRIPTFQALSTKLFSKDLALGPEKSKMRNSSVWTMGTPAGAWVDGDGSHQAWRSAGGGGHTTLGGGRMQARKQGCSSRRGSEQSPLEREVSQEE